MKPVIMVSIVKTGSKKTFEKMFFFGYKKIVFIESVGFYFTLWLLFHCRVKVNYQVVDPSVEAAKARLEAMRHGKFMKIKLRKKKTSPEESLDKSFGKSYFTTYIILTLTYKGQKSCFVIVLFEFFLCNMLYQ